MLQNFLGLHLAQFACLSCNFSGGTLYQSDPPDKLIGLRVRHFWESLVYGSKTDKSYYIATTSSMNLRGKMTTVTILTSEDDLTGAVFGT